MHHVLQSSPVPGDGTSFYRGFMPYSLVNMFSDINVENVGAIQKVSWEMLSKYQAICLQRPFNATHLHQITQMKRMRPDLHIIADYDDDLYNVMSDNPFYQLYHGQRENFLQCLKLADVVTTSTAYLQETLQKHTNKHVILIPNTLPPEKLWLRKTRTESKRKLLWRGGSSHRRDVRKYAHTLNAFLSTTPDIHFHMIGQGAFDEMEDSAKVFHAKITSEQGLIEYANGSKIDLNNGMDLPIFYQYLIAQQAHAMVVPLHDCHFNRCKSNIAMLEAVLAGARPIVPKWKSWLKPSGEKYDHVLYYTDKEKMRKCLEIAFDEPYDGEKMEKLHEELRNDFDWKKTTLMRQRLLNDVCGQWASQVCRLTPKNSAPLPTAVD